MHRAPVIRCGLVLVTVALGLVGASSSGCGSKSSGGGGGPLDAGVDTTFPTYDAGLYDGGDDGGPFLGETGEAGPLPVPPKIFLVNASPDAPPLRFCLGLGTPNDAGVLVTAGLAPTPDRTAEGAALPGIFPGFGTVLSDYGLDLDTLTIDVFALDATNPAVAHDTYDGGPDGGLEVPCESLIGSDGRGSASDGGVLQEGRDYWYVGTVPMGQLGHGTTWLAAVTGCVPGDTQGAALCPSGYSASTGDLALLTWQLDTQTVIDGGALGAQLAQASSEWDNFAKAHGVTTVAGFFVPGDGGADDASAADGAGGSPWSTFTAIPIASDAGFGALAPKTLARVPGLTFDGTSAFYAQVIDSTGLPVSPTPIGWPLTSTASQPVSVTSFGWGGAVPDGGALRNGAGFVFVLVGNPAATSLYVSPADGGPADGADSGVLNGHYPHFLAFPVAN